MRLRARHWTLIGLATALLVGFFVSGFYLYRAAIGLDPSAFPAGHAMQAVGKLLFPKLDITVAGVTLALLPLLVLAIAVGVVVARSRRAPAPDASRRSFLAGAASGAGAGLAAAAVGGFAAFARAFLGVGNHGRGWAPVGREIFGGAVVRTNPEWKEAWKGSRVQSYRRLGRTEWQVSDIVMGTGPLKRDGGDDLVRLALSRGINYVDTSPDYSASGSEDAVGRGIRDFDRSRLFLATKWCTPIGHLPPEAPVAQYKAVVEDSLRRLGTDYVDLVHVHSCDEVERLLSENMHQAFDRLREEGKVRFLGFSSHTPNLVQVASAAIESGRFDVMMLAYHHGIWSQLDQVIARARREQDMGVVAMKTLKGARHESLVDFREHADAYSQAALKWTLSNPDVCCAVISMFKPQHIDEYLYASGQAPGQRDVATLREYDRQILGSYCAPHCGACLETCPEHVPIHDVLRHRMYFEDYGWQKEAMRLYSRLGTNASACAECSAPCLGSCPIGVPIPERTRQAHRLLTLS